MTHHRQQLRSDALQAGLTSREADALVEYGEGLTMAGIAFRLQIAESTAKHSLARARRRTGVSTNAELLVLVAYHREAA